MMADQSSSLAELISAAVLNKYDEVGGCLADEVAVVESAVRNETENGLLGRLRPIHSALDDIHNQVVVLSLIERYWSSPPRLERPMTMLNGCSFGRLSDPVFRSVDEVEDYGGVVPIPKEEVRQRLDELERLCVHSIRGLAASALADKALALAYIHGALIRIHPFADGNGRTARLFVFYALRCWGMPLFPIPKVRNNPAWQRAMSKAVAGDALELKEELLLRMNGSKSPLPSD